MSNSTISASVSDVRRCITYAKEELEKSGKKHDATMNMVVDDNEFCTDLLFALKYFYGVRSHINEVFDNHEMIKDREKLRKMVTETIDGTSNYTYRDFFDQIDEMYKLMNNIEKFYNRVVS